MAELTIALTGVAALLELWLVYRYRFLLELFERNSVMGIAFSMMLSWLLGEAFGATGMVVLLSAIGSTIVTALFYKFGAGALLSVESLLAALGMAA